MLFLLSFGNTLLNTLRDVLLFARASSRDVNLLVNPWNVQFILPNVLFIELFFLSCYWRYADVFYFDS